MLKKEIKIGFTNKKYQEGNKFILLKNKNDFNHNINYKILSKFDFVPKLIKETKDKLIWEFIEGDILKKPNNDDIKQLGRIIKVIHNSDLKFPKNNLKKRMNKYLNIINEKNKNIFAIKKNYQDSINLICEINEYVPCHNDIWIQNIIKDKNEKIWIVDWEYATMGNRYFDIAYFMESFKLKQTQKKIFLNEYNKFDNYSKTNFKLLFRYKKFVNYLTLCWALSQKKIPFSLDEIIKKLN